jgi:glycosyltransferase involved in cell wall biosynthesis
MKNRVIYNITSYKREDTLINTIKSIYNQCDVINLALNDYDEIPVELYDKKINLFITDNDKGDAYKFYKLMDSEGYFFTIDDDLIYPENYTDYMIGKIEEYKRKSIVTLHSRSFESFPIKNFYGRHSIVNHFNSINPNDIKVQFGGTGVMAFHTDLFKIGMDYFREPNMADVWIGKYSNENNIDIICVKHNSGFVTQQKINESIYENEFKSDLKQTVITNNSFTNKTVSIIVPTFNTVEYLKECLDSIVNSCKEINNFEILVGIDNCEETLEFVKTNKFNPSVQFFYFNENVGPYIIKNTLSKRVKSENIIFFDSDDIMKKDMVKEIIKDLNNYECVKPMFHNFYGEINESDPKYKESSRLWGEGVFGIKKEAFLRFNGFEGWRCAADSDFMARIQKNGVRTSLGKEILFYRRIHSKGLTSDVKTNYGSSLRKHYVELSRQKTNFGPLDELITSEFVLIYNNLDFTDVTVANQLTTIKEIPKVDNKPNTQVDEVIKKLDNTTAVRVVESRIPEVKKYVKPVEEKTVKPEPVTEFKLEETNISNNNVRETVLSLVRSNTKVVRQVDPNVNKDAIINRRSETKPIEKPTKTVTEPKIKPLKGKLGFNF